MAIDSTDKKFPIEVLVAEDAGDVRDIVVWLLRSAGYRALAAADRTVIQSLFLRESTLLVVGTMPTVFSEGLDMLVFLNVLHPHVPVLLVSGSAFGRWPEVERWANGFPRKSCGVTSFRTKLQCLVSQATTLRRFGRPNPIYGRLTDRERRQNRNAGDRPFPLLHSHAPTFH